MPTNTSQTTTTTTLVTKHWRKAVYTLLFLFGLWLVWPIISTRFSSPTAPEPAANITKPEPNVVTPPPVKEEVKMPIAVTKDDPETLAKLAKVEKDLEESRKLLNENTEQMKKTAESNEAVRKAAEEEIAAAKAKIKEEIAASFPGEARIVVEAYNPRVHKQKQVDKTLGEKTFTSEGALPVYEVSKTSRTVKAKIEGEEKIVKDVYPVLSTDGRPLTLETTPELSNGKNPYRLTVEGSQGYKAVWFAEPN